MSCEAFRIQPQDPIRLPDIHIWLHFRFHRAAKRSIIQEKLNERTVRISKIGINRGV